MKKFIQEFKEFALQGNVVDMAVAVVIGAAFGKIVTSLVDDIIMPLIGSIIGNVNFTELKCTLNGSNIMYGNFIQTIIDFLIVALCIFLVLKGFMGLKNKAATSKNDEAEVEEEKVVVETELSVLTEIRDMLNKKEL